MMLGFVVLQLAGYQAKKKTQNRQKTPKEGEPSKWQERHKPQSLVRNEALKVVGLL